MSKPAEILEYEKIIDLSSLFLKKRYHGDCCGVTHKCDSPLKEVNSTENHTRKRDRSTNYWNMDETRVKKSKSTEKHIGKRYPSDSLDEGQSSNKKARTENDDWVKIDENHLLPKKSVNLLAERKKQKKK